MLIIWLVLIPSVAAFVCKGACERCAMDKNQGSASCALCRDCNRFENHRMMDGQKIPTLSDQQMKDLKELEKSEFKKVMQEYGFKPEDLIDTEFETSIEETLETTTRKVRKTPDPTSCVEYNDCFMIPPEVDENYSGRLLISKDKANSEGIKKNCINKCMPRYPPSTTQCPPVTPCKKALNKITRTDGPTSSTLPPYVAILHNIVTLRDSDYDLNDQGCPPQPICSDYEDYDMRVTKRGSISPPNIITKSCCSEILLKISTTPPCVTCMPFCQQPCMIMSQTPFLTTPMPRDTRVTRITTKSMAAKHIPNERSEENENTPPKEEISTRTSERTTKDYIYVYVGVPKDVKHLRKG